ncbi:hypothetical protein [Promineifilum sp.]|uniref:hypothetical protein n=1 Tax=Promineifilum sp. TaxID=2664178 RepID=UPI0035B05DC7
MFERDRQWLVRVAAVALLLFAVAAVAAAYRVGQTRAAPSATPAVAAHVLNLSCTSVDNVGASFVKIADVGQFTVQSPDSLVELTFYGRIYASFTNGTGLRYELRVDDAPTTLGRIRAILKSAEVGGGVGRNATMGGFYEGLAAGTHTVSIWAQTANGTDSDTVMFDAGCWSSDVVTIKEYLPFGTIALPAILSN